MNNATKCLWALAACMALTCQAQVYKYIDKDGKVQYTDRPPDDAKKSEIKVDKPSTTTKGTEDWRDKERDLNSRLNDKRRLQDECVKAKTFLQNLAAYQAAHPKERWVHNGVEITPALVDEARRVVRDTCAN
jgi:hypothetical protein